MSQVVAAAFHPMAEDPSNKAFPVWSGLPRCALCGEPWYLFRRGGQYLCVKHVEHI